jgi:hypothetical protein
MTRKKTTIVLMTAKVVAVAERQQQKIVIGEIIWKMVVVVVENPPLQSEEGERDCSKMGVMPSLLRLLLQPCPDLGRKSAAPWRLTPKWQNREKRLVDYTIKHRTNM